MSTNKITSGELKVLLRQYLKVNKYYVYAEFVNYLEQVTDKEYTQPQVAGIVKQLVDKHEIERVARGIYQRSIPVYEQGYKKLIRDCLEDTISNLSIIIKGVDLVALSDEEYAEVKNVKVLADQIRAVIDDLADEEGKEAV